MHLQSLATGVDNCIYKKKINLHNVNFFQQFDGLKSILIKKKKLIDYLNYWQLNKCVCLEQIPGQGSRGANECSSSCSGKYPNETSIKFQKDFGGNQTYNLFKSGTFFVW